MLSFDDRMQLLHTIDRLCGEDPTLLGDIVQAGTNGIQDALQEANARAADFEVIAITLHGVACEKGRVSPKMKARVDDLLQIKIEKWKGKSSLVWDHLI